MAEHKPERWTVVQGKGFVQTKRESDGVLKDTGFINLSCGHRTSGACGGCYARFYLAFELMKSVPEAAVHIVKEVDAALEAEAAARRLQGKA